MRRFLAWLTGRANERGAILVISAIALPVLLTATALAFDIGREVDTNRSTQALADAVALDGAQFIDGQSATAADPYVQINGTNDYQLAQVIQYEAAESALRNSVADWPDDTVSMGTCAASGDEACATFTPIEDCPLSTVLPTPAPGSSPGVGGECYQDPSAGKDASAAITAVQVHASEVTSFVFQVGSTTSNKYATAMLVYPSSCQSNCSTTTTTVPGSTTTTVPCQTNCLVGESAFSLGTSLANVSPTLVNAFLPKWLDDSSFDVTAVGWEGLLDSDVSIGDILAANPSVGTLSNLLEVPISLPTLVQYLYNTYVAEDSPAAAELSESIGASGTIASNIGASTTVELCQLISLDGVSSCNDGGTTLAPVAYTDVSAAQFLTGVAELANGVNFANVSVSGLGVVNGSVTAISGVYQTPLGPADQPSCPTGFTPCPLTANEEQVGASLTIASPSLTGITVDLSLQVTGASATATLADLDCGTGPTNESATIDGSSSVASVTATMKVNTGLTQTSVPVTISAPGSTIQDTFTGPFGDSSPAPQSQSSNLSVQLGSSGLTGALLTSFDSYVTNTLDPDLAPLLSELGVNVGNTQVTDQLVDCQVPALVQ